MKSKDTRNTLITLCLIAVGTPPFANGEITWSENDYPHAIANPALAVHGGAVYTLGGTTFTGPGYYDGVATDEIHAYDPVTQQWSATAVAHLPYAAFELGTPAVHGNKLYMSPSLGPTENNGWGTHNQLIEWDFSSANAVETAAYPGYSRIWSSAVFASQDGTVHSVGGWNGGTVNSIWRLDDAGTLTPLPATHNAQGRPKATAMLADGRAAIFGFRYDRFQLEIFDPETEQIVHSDSGALPEDLEWASSAWTDKRGDTFVANWHSQKILQFDPETLAFTDTGMLLPAVHDGETSLSCLAYDPMYDRLYAIESHWNGSAFESSMWIGQVPEPASVLLLLPALFTLRRR